MARPTLVHLNPIELYYSLMISLERCSESCVAVDILSMKTCIPSEKSGKC